MRKGPEQHASETEIGTIQKGNDQGYWMVLENKQHIHRWVSITEPNEKKPIEINTQYNGETIRVIIGSKKIYAFYTYYKTILPVLVYSTHYKHYWVSKQKNAVLIQLKTNEYSFIDGHQILQFKTHGDILRFDAPMNFSGTGYAYVLTKERAYLLLESKWIDWDLKQKDPYKVFYESSKNVKGTSFVSKVIFNAWK